MDNISLMATLGSEGYLRLSFETATNMSCNLGKALQTMLFFFFFCFVFLNYVQLADLRYTISFWCSVQQFLSCVWSSPHVPS